MMTSRRCITSNISSPEPALYETFIEIYTKYTKWKYLPNNYQNLLVIPIYRMMYNVYIYQKAKICSIFIENRFAVWYNNINQKQTYIRNWEERSMKKGTTFVVITKSNKVKEITALETKEDAISYMEEKYLQYTRSVPVYDYKNSFIKDDRSIAVVSSGIFSIKIMLYQGKVQRVMSKWKDN